MIERLVTAIHPRLRAALAALWLAGAVISGSTCVLAIGRIGAGSAAVFGVVAAALAALAFFTWHAARPALVAGLVLAGLQIVGAAGAAWELFHQGESAKTRELRDLGIDPAAGVVLNLVYSCVAAGLFLWVLTRALRAGRAGT